MNYLHSAGRRALFIIETESYTEKGFQENAAFPEE